MTSPGLRLLWRDAYRVGNEPKAVPSLASDLERGVNTQRSLGSPKPLFETGKQFGEQTIVQPGSTEGTLRPVVQIPVVCQSPRVSNRILIAKPKIKPLNRNDKIRLGLERAYPDSYKAVLDQAFAAYYYANPMSQNLPEIYELSESGFLDQGIEACGLHSWIIGRCK